MCSGLVAIWTRCGPPSARRSSASASWVVLAVLVSVPFSARTWALPVLFRLYRIQKDCQRQGVPHRKKTELAREMLDVFSSWATDRRIELAADSAFCSDTVTHHLTDRVVLFGAMRPDAVLTEPPPSPRPNTQGGRPRKRGRLLRKPEQIARDRRTPWQSTEATLYGRKTTVQFKTLCAQWYRATGTRLLRIVIVATDSGTLPYRVFFSFDATLDVRTILETYAVRWGIEVFFSRSKTAARLRRLAGTKGGCRLTCRSPRRPPLLDSRHLVCSRHLSNAHRSIARAAVVPAQGRTLLCRYPSNRPTNRGPCGRS